MRCALIVLLLPLAAVAEAENLGSAEQAAPDSNPSSVEPAAKTFVKENAAGRGAEPESQMEAQTPALDAVREEGKKPEPVSSQPKPQTQAPPDSSLPTQVQVCSAASEGESAEIAAVKVAVASKKKRVTDELIQIKLSASLRPLTKNNAKLVETLTKFGWTGTKFQKPPNWNDLLAALEDSSKCHASTAASGTDGVQQAPKSLNGRSLDPDDEDGKWWLGDFDAMTFRSVVAMDSSAVVLCYGRLDRGGCRFAKVDVKEPKLPTGLLSRLAWEEEQLFHSATIGRLEARRLDAGHMALCFERIEDSSIGCLIASVNSTASPKIVLGEAVEVTSAPHLLSLVVTTTTRFSMCHRPAKVAPDGGDCYSSIGTGAPCTTASCQLGEVDGLNLRWADAAPHITKV